jgi:hypothetical protein
MSNHPTHLGIARWVAWNTGFVNECVSAHDPEGSLGFVGSELCWQIMTEVSSS